MTDPISDMLARIRNAHQAFHRTVRVPDSKLKRSLAEILKTDGYIQEFELQEDHIEITLKYAAGKPLISGLRKVSRPGRRVYVGAGEIPKVQNGLGICVLSTSRGVLDGEQARADNVGGELLCEIW